MHAQSMGKGRAAGAGDTLPRARRRGTGLTGNLPPSILDLLDMSDMSELWSGSEEAGSRWTLNAPRP